jgi:hypothetical protein
LLPVSWGLSCGATAAGTGTDDHPADTDRDPTARCNTSPPLPALKPGTELSLAESQALADQASTNAPSETQITASQRAMGRAVRKTANLPAAGANVPP